MSRARLIAVTGIAAFAIAAVVWQGARERRMSDCVNSGGAWHGPTSTCTPAPRPILERDGLKRT